MIDSGIIFNEQEHTYTDSETGKEFISCNKVIDRFIVPFDKKKISSAVAKKEGVSQETIINRWDKKRDNSHDYGNDNHYVIEDYYRNGNMVPRDHKMYDALQATIDMLSQYKKVLSEENIALREHNIAGKPDLLCFRNTRKKIVDIPDIKTNLYNGIKMDTVKRVLDNDRFITYTGDIEKHYNRYFLDPISHLEQSGYNRYCLQTSIYAFIMEQAYGYGIGSLSILFYYYCKRKKKMKVRRYPIPYMRLEVLAMIKSLEKMKSLS